MRIVISGTVGVGKSTTASALIKKLEEKGYTVNYLKEGTVDSPYLGHYYEEPEKWAFIAQMDFLLERFKQWIIDEDKRKKQIADGNDKVITVYDRHFLDDYIFAELHSIKESISNLNSIVYQVIYKEMLEKLHSINAQPDYFFLLEAELPTIINRLSKRGREEEQSTNEDYWRDLYNSYYSKPKFIYHFKNNTKKVIHINTENVTPDNVVELILKEILFK